MQIFQQTGQGLFALAMLAIMSGAAQSQANPPRYVDKQGEEIFGPDYLPQAPSDPGVPLQVGQPSSGFQGAPDTMLQSDVAGTGTAAMSVTELQAARPNIPMRTSIRKRLKLPRFKAANFESLNNVTGLIAADAQPVAAIQSMKVHFVDVGQGAAAILEFPCGIAVVDTGGEQASGARDGGKKFVAYLNLFFAARPALNRTIDVLFTSHPHADHQKGLSEDMAFGSAATGFKIRNIVDNGQSGTSDSLGNQSDARERARVAGARYSAVQLHNIFSATGATNNVIDPFKCAAIDPVVTAFWGSQNEAVAGPAVGLRHVYNTANNHSVVIRIDFGKASMLFTGDLQGDAARDMLAEYKDNPKVFDVDIYQAGHHGADNGTIAGMLKAMSPKIAVISMGDKSSTASKTAFDYGHPRLSTLTLLQKPGTGVSEARAPKTFWGFAGQDMLPTPVKITKAVYGTGWEGTIVMTARSDGSYSVDGP